MHNHENSHHLVRQKETSKLLCRKKRKSEHKAVSTLFVTGGTVTILGGYSYKGVTLKMYAVLNAKMVKSSNVEQKKKVLTAQVEARLFFLKRQTLA